jgi:hypothetical protein
VNVGICVKVGDTVGTIGVDVTVGKTTGVTGMVQAVIIKSMIVSARTNQHRIECCLMSFSPHLQTDWAATSPA